MKCLYYNNTIFNLSQCVSIKIMINQSEVEGVKKINPSIIIEYSKHSEYINFDTPEIAGKAFNKLLNFLNNIPSPLADGSLSKTICSFSEFKSNNQCDQ